MLRESGLIRCAARRAVRKGGGLEPSRTSRFCAGSSACSAPSFDPLGEPSKPTERQPHRDARDRHRSDRRSHQPETGRGARLDERRPESHADSRGENAGHDHELPVPGIHIPGLVVLVRLIAHGRPGREPVPFCRDMHSLRRAVVRTFVSTVAAKIAPTSVTDLHLEDSRQAACAQIGAGRVPERTRSAPFACPSCSRTQPRSRPRTRARPRRPRPAQRRRGTWTVDQEWMPSLSPGSVARARRTGAEPRSAAGRCPPLVYPCRPARPPSRSKRRAGAARRRATSPQSSERRCSSRR